MLMAKNKVIPTVTRVENVNHILIAYLSRRLEQKNLKGMKRKIYKKDIHMKKVA